MRKLIQRMEMNIMKIAVDEVKSDLYNSIYRSNNDISALVETLRQDPNNSSCMIIVDDDNNIICGVDVWRAYKQLDNEGIQGFSKIKAAKQSYKNDENIVAMIENHDHSHSSNEELCRATYAYYESYRRCYEKGHEFYLTGKQLYKILPSIFEIKQVSDRTKNLSWSCYEDYISVGRKIHELEEQNDYDNLECLMILLENNSPLSMRHDGLLSQISEWTDEIRAEIRKTGRESGVSKGIIKRIAKKKSAQISNSSVETSNTDEPINVVADLWDEERDRSMNSFDLLDSAYNTIESCWNGVKSIIEYESETEMTTEARERGYEVLSLLEEMTKYVTERFSL